MFQESQKSIENCLLAALPTKDYQWLFPHLEQVKLPLRQTLYNASDAISYVYFPNDALISLLSIMENGDVAEVGVVAKEGMLGLPVCWGGHTTTTTAVVQIPGSAIRLKAEILKTEFDRGGMLQSLLLRYMQMLFTQVSQSAACYCLHTLEERLARWLLTIQDLTQLNELPLTQELISHMLGVRRSSVTVTASTLQQAGMLRYKRGRMNILNREALEATACECYRVVKDELARLFETESR